MTSMRVSRVFFVVIIAIALGWLGALYSADAGWFTPSLGYPSVITLAAAIVLELVLGIRVLRDRERPVADRMNPLAAARTLVLAQAGTYAGAAIGGWHLGILVHRLPHAGFGPAVITESIVQVIAALILVLVGFMVEQWCRIPPEDPDGTANHTRRPPDASGAQPTARRAAPVDKPKP